MRKLPIENKTQRKDPTSMGSSYLIVKDEAAIQKGVTLDEALQFLETHGIFDPESVDSRNGLQIEKDGLHQDDDVSRVVAKFTLQRERDGGPQDYCANTVHYLEVRRVSPDRFVCTKKEWVYFS